MPDDARLPTAFDPQGTDERLPKGKMNGDISSTWLPSIDPNNEDPWIAPDESRMDFNLIDLAVDPLINPDLGNIDATRARHVLGKADDGFADFNNGIGQIIFSNTTSTTSFSIVVIDPTTGLPVDPFQLPADDGIGIDIDPTTANPTVVQGPSMGQIIIGNPTNVDWTADNSGADFAPLGWQSFDFQADANFPDRLQEGIFFANPSQNELMGTINIDGAFFGVANFPGAVDSMNLGFLGGDIIADGEISNITIVGDSGYILYSDGRFRTTGSFIQAGRNLGSFTIGGTSSTSVSVIGDLTSTVDRPALKANQAVVAEAEVDLHQADQAAHDIQFLQGGTVLKGNEITGTPVFSSLKFVSPAGQDVGDGTVQPITNDTVGTAQYIGRLTGRTEVFGDIGGVPLIGLHTNSGDMIDMYSVAVDGQKEIRIDLLANIPMQLTVTDEFGNILASRGPAAQTGELVFTPNQAGLIYVRIFNSAGVQGNAGYRLIVQGIEGTTLGEYNDYRSVRFRADGGKTITTKFGSVGTVRAGQDAIDQATAWIGNVTIDSADSIWNVTAGGIMGINPDGPNGGNVVAPVAFTAAKDIGTVIAGVGFGDGSGSLGGAIAEGVISAGRNIGGLYAYRNTADNRTYGDIGGFASDATISTMTSLIGALQVQAGGSIGVIHADNRIWGTTTVPVLAGASFEIGPSGTIDLFEASSILNDGDHPGNRDFDMDPDFSGFLSTSDQPLLIRSSNPSGSNIKFVRTPSAHSTFDNNDSIIIGPDEVISLVDDSGAVFTVKVTAGTTFGNQSSSVARIITQPIEGSVGVAVTRIIANLNVGADLVITNNSGNVEIGDIVVVANGVNTNSKSNIIFNGTGKTDVYLLRAVGQFESIKNTTSGDIVAIDVGGVSEVKWKGNIGRVSNLVDIGPKLIGPNLGVAVAAPTPKAFGGDDGLSLVAGVPLQVGWTVGTNLQQDGLGLNQPGFTTFDGLLDGITVRETTFNNAVDLISTDGALGDAIIQTSVKKILINNDKTTPFGDFHGLEGVVYSEGNVEFINVGDGILSHRRGGPFLTAGVTALGQVEHVLVEGAGHKILGAIGGEGIGVLGNIQQDVRFGIGKVEARDGAEIFGAIISTDVLNSFFSLPELNGANVQVPRAIVDKVQLKGGSLIDTVIRGTSINTISVNGGFWDANIVEVTANIGKIIADEFRDSTDLFSPLGTNFWYLNNQSLIVASGDLDRLETTGRAGDISDLTVDLQGDLKKVRAMNINGLILQVDNTVGLVDAKGTLARSQFTVGTADRIQAQNDIARLSLSAAGPTKKFSSKSGSITRLDLILDGPDAELKKIDAAGDITGSIQVSGPIGQMRTKTGDLVASIRTFSGDGDIKKIQTGRDLLSTMDIDGGVSQFKIGRNFGNGGRVLINGPVKKIDTKNGIFNAQLFVAGQLSNMVAGGWGSSASVTTEDNIKSITINGTLDGSIISHAGGITKLVLNGMLDSAGQIKAFEAGIKGVTINGNADGTIFADQEITKVDIKSGSGMAGDFTGTIQSADSIKSVSVAGAANGAYVQALHTLEKLILSGSVTNTIVGAGDLIKLVQINGLAKDSYILAGLEDLGLDNALGGNTLPNQDVVTAASLDKAIVKGGIDNVVFASGVSAGTDGLFSTIDGNTDLALGTSTIGSITVDGTAINGNLVLADTSIGSTAFSDANPDVTIQIVNADAPTLPGTGTVLDFSNGAPASFTEADGDTVTASVTKGGVGKLEYDAQGNITGIILTASDSKTDFNLSVTNVVGNGVVDLKNAVTVVAADDLNFNNFNLDANLTGSALVTIDGSVTNFTARTVNTTGNINIGGAVRSATFDVVSNGVFNITSVDRFTTTLGGFTGTLSSQTIGQFSAAGDVIDATIFGRDEIGSFSTSGAFGVDPQGSGFNPAYIASNISIGSFTAATTDKAIISAGDSLGTVTVNGTTMETQFIAGMILGSDANFGGSLTAKDLLTAGSISRINIRGDFIQSSVAAGINPGADSFFGTGDDLAALGLSNLGLVTISGNALGSQSFSQNYAFTSAGTMSDIKVQGKKFDQNGNLITQTISVTPVAPEVTSSTVRLDGKDFFADIFLSQDISESTIIPKQGGISSVTVVSADGGVDPVEGADYTVSFDRDLKRVTVSFDRTFIETNPGVFTITLDGSTLVSKSGVKLDGNKDGISGDDYAFNVLVGDAGDRTVQGQEYDPDNDPNTPAINFRASSNLDLVFNDLNGTLGRKNHQISIVEILGDHPQNDPIFFPDKMDVDLYKFTASEGDIIQADLTPLVGSGFLGTLSLLRESTGGAIANASQLASGVIIGATDTYVFEITGATIDPTRLPLDLTLLGLDVTNATGFFDPFGVPISQDLVTNDVGRYQLNAMIFSDGDTGFNMATDVNLTNLQTTRIESAIGPTDTIGFPSDAFTDVDVYKIASVKDNNGTANKLDEGDTVTIKLNVEEFGSDLGGFGGYEVALFKINNPTNLSDGHLVAAPVDRGNLGHSDTTYTLKIPEVGEYAILVQGAVGSNYALDITVDTTTKGDRFGQPRVQNVLLELNGGRADWLGRFGTDLTAMDLTQLGFESSTDQIINATIQAVEAKFDAVGITVNVSTDVASFAGEEFTTVFMTSNFGTENFFGGVLGEAESLDPLNKNQEEQAVIYVNAHNSFSAGQEQFLADDLANTIAHELGHTFGLRHQNSNNDGLMGFGNIGIPRNFSTTDYSLREILLGMQSEVQMLDWAFDFPA